MFKLILLSVFVISGFAGEFFYNKGAKVEVFKLNESRTIRDKNIEYYITSTGKKIGISNDMIVKCEKNIKCKSLLNSLGFIKVANITDSIFLVTVEYGQNIFELSSSLYEHKDIKFAHPNFIKVKTKR